mmetsp:Transcript_3428/g.7969  ORF Transcript_3428/g.7969 Transcript_3428/m.7969 type:complete len:313 (-) Transcript_3428:445-1383(-)
MTLPRRRRRRRRGRSGGGEDLELAEGLEEAGGDPLEALEQRPGSEVTRPVRVRAVRVGEEVVGFDGPLCALGVLRVRVGRRCRVEHVHLVARQRVGVVHQLVQVPQPLRRRLVVKVQPHRHHDVVSLGHGGLVKCRLHQRRDAFVNIEIGELCVVHHGDRVVPKRVEVEALGGAVVAPVRARQAPEDLGVRAERLRGAPHPFALLGLLAALPVLVVDAAEEEGVEARPPAQEGRLGGRVPERVDLPPDARGEPVELLGQEPVPERGLVDHGRVVGGRLVVHAPPAVDEIELPGRHEAAHRVLHGRRLIVEPS